MSYYTNTIGRIRLMPEPALEPPDCWPCRSMPPDELEDEYDRAEDEMNGKITRRGGSL